MARLLPCPMSVPLLTACILGACIVSTHAATYHLDAGSGNDSADGLTPATACQTLAKANSVIYQPGDSLLLKSGATWTGRLQPQGSGTLAERIVIDRYGGGPKTFIHGGGVSGGTVTLENAEYWTLRNLEITNTGTTEPNKMGIIVRKDCNHGRIARCRIHASSDGKSWNPIAESAFENPDELQTVRLEIPTTDRFFKLEALQEAQNRNWTSVEEFDILLKLANH